MIGADDQLDPMFGVSAAPAKCAQFPATQWSIVLDVGSDSLPEARQALEELCRRYWYPLYAYVRRHGHSHHDAQDCTQEFFARIIASEGLAMARRERGRFRNFLLAALRHFLTNEWRRAHAAKRGGGATPVSLDLPEDAAERFARDPADCGLTPEQAFDRNWALEVIAQATAELRQEYDKSGRGALFDSLAPVLWGDVTDDSPAERGVAAGLGPKAFAVALHRLRRRVGDRIRRRVSETLTAPAEVETELQHLIAALSAENH